MSKARSVRAPDSCWDTWAGAAKFEGKSLNRWIADACDLVADRGLAEIRRAQSERLERERVKDVMRGNEFTFKPDPK